MENSQEEKFDPSRWSKSFDEVGHIYDKDSTNIGGGVMCGKYGALLGNNYCTANMDTCPDCIKAEEIKEGIRTIPGKLVPRNIRGIIYFCDFNHKDLTIKVVGGKMLIDSFLALEIFSNTRNPESQLVTGKTAKEVRLGLKVLHANMKNKKWLQELSDCL